MLNGSDISCPQATLSESLSKYEIDSTLVFLIIEKSCLLAAWALDYVLWNNSPEIKD